MSSATKQAPNNVTAVAAHFVIFFILLLYSEAEIKSTVRN